MTRTDQQPRRAAADQAAAPVERGPMAWLEGARIGAQGSTSERLKSVDALRGFDMFLIIGGVDIIRALHIPLQSPMTAAINVQLDHAEWVGFHFWDIVMPLFLLLVGVSIPFAFAKRLGDGASKASQWPHIIKRFVLLWILGMVVQGNLLTYDPDEFIVFDNTLQAIAVGYLIAVVLALYLPVRVQMLATAALAGVYWWVMETLPVPGFGVGDYSPEGNAAFFIDQLVLGPWQEQDSSYTWVLSGLTFGVTVMLGVFAGYLLRMNVKQTRKLVALTLTGFALVAAGLLWGLVHPIIKQIWTGSFALFSAGLCYLLLAFFYLVIDVWKLTRWARWLIIIGANSIFAYVAWHTFDFKLIGDLFAAGLEPFTGDWYPFVRYTIAFGVLFVILWVMYRKRFFIKV